MLCVPPTPLSYIVDARLQGDQDKQQLGGISSTQVTYTRLPLLSLSVSPALVVCAVAHLPLIGSNQIQTYCSKSSTSSPHTVVHILAAPLSVNKK